MFEDLQKYRIVVHDLKNQSRENPDFRLDIKFRSADAGKITGSRMHKPELIFRKNIF